MESGRKQLGQQKITDTLKALPTYGPLLPAVVTSANPQEAIAALADGTSVSLRMDGMRWARPYRSDTQQGPTPRKVTDVVQAGQQIWVRRGRCPVAGASARRQLRIGLHQSAKRRGAGTGWWF